FDHGGAIFSNGPLTVTNATFSGNSAAASGAAIQNVGATSIVTVANSTFSDNSASASGLGGAINNVDILGSVTNSTFSGNNSAAGGGTICNANLDNRVTVTNSILGNSTSGGSCCQPFDELYTDGGHNIDDGDTCGFKGTGCSNTSGTSFCNTPPLLDPAGLAGHGGPTQTIALCAGPGTPASCTGASPAINAGNETICAAPPV